MEVRSLNLYEKDGISNFSVLSISWKLLFKSSMNKHVKAVAFLAIIVIAMGAFLWINLNNSGPTRNSKTTYYSYIVVNAFPHDTNAFTQGLIYLDGFLYESTGLYGESSLRRVDLTTGNIIQKLTLADEFFGEGITSVDDVIIQLTWKSQIGFVYNKSSFVLLDKFTYPTEGWGLTFDGNYLIMSDGSDALFFLEPKTFQQIKKIQVRENNNSIMNLNELEYIDGEIYANIWLQQKIAIINPETGQVRAYIDLATLQGATSSSSEAVLNGIAYDSEQQRLFVTGKCWSQIFEIELVPEN